MTELKTNKLLEFQRMVGAISKDETNPFFKSKYFDINGLIEAIKPVLNKLDLVLVQPIVVALSSDNKNAIQTLLLDGDKTILSSTFILPDNIDPQKMGSAITYYRRYAIQSMLLLQAEDDDSNVASGKAETKIFNKGFEEANKTNSRL